MCPNKDISMNQASTTFGILAIAMMCIVTYVVVSPRLAMSDVQNLVWGPAAIMLFPIILACFGVGFAVVLIVVSAREATSK